MCSSFSIFYCQMVYLLLNRFVSTVQFHGLPVCLDSLCDLTGFHVGVAKMFSDSSITGKNRRRFFQVLYGLLRLVLPEVEPSQAVKHIAVPRPKSQGLFY